MRVKEPVLLLYMIARKSQAFSLGMNDTQNEASKAGEVKANPA
jgi:hypothetical protein